jgi:hypothetical protein
MFPYIPLRRKPVRKKRPGTRRGEPTKAQKTAERERVYLRSGGMCELRGEDGEPLHQQHRSGVLPREGSVFERWHLVHLHCKRRFGWTEAHGNTLLGGCYACHILGMHAQGKKPATE